jgi:hypothetical protein
MVFEWLAREYDVFPEIYIEKEQIVGAKNDQAMRKSHEQDSWVRALSLFMCKGNHLKLYKIKFAMEVIQYFLNGWLVNMMFFPRIT